MTHDEVRDALPLIRPSGHRIIGGHRKWYGMSSTHLERDFVEARRRCSRTGSGIRRRWPRRDHSDRRPIPSKLVMQMRRASEFGQGLDVRGQMVFARVSLSLHDRDPRPSMPGPFKEIPTATCRMRTWTARIGNWCHALANPGYASGLLHYMWSLVISKACSPGSTSGSLGPVRPAAIDLVFAAGKLRSHGRPPCSRFSRPAVHATVGGLAHRETPSPVRIDGRALLLSCLRS